MTPQDLRAAAATLAWNLALFIAVVSLPAFQQAHHHWIFPLLALLMGAQWALTRKAARQCVLSFLAFLLVMGIVRHATILACFDRCSFKLALAGALAAPVFFLQRRAGEAGFWTPLRCGLAAWGSSLWAGYLALKGLGAAPWALDGLFAVLGLIFWLGRSDALYLLTSLGIFSGVAIRATANEYAIIGLGAVWSVALPLALAHRVEARLAARPKTAPRPRPVLTAAVAALLAAGVIGPTFLTTNIDSRRRRLAKMAPAFPVKDPSALSALAAGLRAHVVALAATIGERDAFQPVKQLQARDYVAGRFKAMGYEPKVLSFEAGKKTFYNVEAVRRRAPADAGGAWVIGAHYDSAPGTPGADDNASGVAVLLETARLLKERGISREIRFVAFATEEPPNFGTRDMGSWRYAQGLKESGVDVHGMISLEMLGYYNPRRGSQLYPPFLHLTNPDHGAFVGIVSDVKSRRLLAFFKKAWEGRSSFPLSASLLPGPLADLAMSDQLNFWDLGFPALMLSDTAFYRNPNYHQDSDRPDTLDYERMAAVTRALAGVLQ